MAQVRLENICKRWAGTEGIEAIDLEIPDGELWVLVGPSGCGKSTILRMIAGLEAPTEGNLFIGDRLVNQVPARQRDVAMVFQNYALYPHMTVAENLTFGLKMRNADAQTIRDRLRTVAKSLNIEHLLQRKPAQLSGGQQQRVALGRAMARSPQVFLLDEPLSNLDAQLRDGTRAELKLLQHQLQTTTLYVTHDQTEAMTLADQMVVLDRGRIQQIGTPLEIYNQPQNLMVATFLGSPAMNILEGIYDGERFMLGEQSIRFPLLQSAQGNRFQIGIRPENLTLLPPEHSDNLRTDAREGDFQILQLKVLVIEPLGSEILVRGSLLDQPASVILFKIPANSPSIHTGEIVKVGFESDQLYLFDGETGDRLCKSA
jgi:multiple sugar transport system ATP-binding protein